jgi:hypothetical protein
MQGVETPTSYVDFLLPLPGSLKMSVLLSPSLPCHCEERGDEAFSALERRRLLRFVRNDIKGRTSSAGIVSITNEESSRATS